VIATVPFDLIVSVLLGLIFAWCARQQFTNGVAPWGRELAAVLSFEAIIIWPVALYFYLVYPDWSWMYFVDPRRLPFGAIILVLLGYVATLLGGYLAGWAILRARKLQALYGVLGAGAFALLVFLIATRRRLVTHGTFAEFHSGHALTFTTSKLIWAMCVTTLGVAAAAALVGFALWEQGKRFRDD
jgi:hypothetical protein